MSPLNTKIKSRNSVVLTLIVLLAMCVVAEAWFWPLTALWPAEKPQEPEPIEREKTPIEQLRDDVGYELFVRNVTLSLTPEDATKFYSGIMKVVRNAQNLDVGSVKLINATCRHMQAALPGILEAVIMKVIPRIVNASADKIQLEMHKAFAVVTDGLDAVRSDVGKLNDAIADFGTKLKDVTDAWSLIKCFGNVIRATFYGMSKSVISVGVVLYVCIYALIQAILVFLEKMTWWMGASKIAAFWLLQALLWSFWSGTCSIAGFDESAREISAAVVVFLCTVPAFCWAESTSIEHIRVMKAFTAQLEETNAAAARMAKISAERDAEMRKLVEVHKALVNAQTMATVATAVSDPSSETPDCPPYVWDQSMESPDTCQPIARPRMSHTLFDRS
jgi:hypothetical protein